MPQKLTFSLDHEYELKNDGSDITCDVILGDIGQSPDTSVKLNTKKLLTNHKQSINDLVVGNDNDLDGKVLRINGNIADTSKDTDKINLRLRVNGGVENINKQFSVTVEQEGEVVVFSLVVRFFCMNSKR
ncbi:MAG TPA: hypothetical protein VIZ28_14780 [Chitinophagaceae bacterium]